MQEGRKKEKKEGLASGDKTEKSAPMIILTV